MSISKLQEKIRKVKNPSAVEFAARRELIPPEILSIEGTESFERCFGEIMDLLRGTVPAVRFDFSSFCLIGPEGLLTLQHLLEKAEKLGFYVLLDGLTAFSDRSAEAAADVLLAGDCVWRYDGLIISPYIGSDSMKPYLREKSKKDLFTVVRTGNRSAGELQDLLTGSRVVHLAAADTADRIGKPFVERCGYSSVGAVGSAAAPDSLRLLRGKYKNMFLLVEGYDYPNANAKNCSYAFDEFGHGALVCAGDTVTGAWRTAPELDYKDAAREAAERMKKNLLRYLTIL